MSSHELVFIHNIPFLVDSAGLVYYYSGTNPGKEPVHIGSTREGILTLLDDWKARIEPNLAAWRASLEPSERGVPLPRAEKPPRAKRAAASGTKSATSLDTGSSMPRTGVEGVS